MLQRFFKRIGGGDLYVRFHARALPIGPGDRANVPAKGNIYSKVITEAARRHDVGATTGGLADQGRPLEIQRKRDDLVNLCTCAALDTRTRL